MGSALGAWDPALPYSLEEFRTHVFEQGLALYRDLPWRRTHDPYAIWVSEVMLQQTQVTRVDGRWQRWLDRFPTVSALASADTADVLSEWQGLGYNRRALALKRAARDLSEMDEFPQDMKELVSLPGIGPATAAGIRAFAFNLPGVYIETNVRCVFLHTLLPDAEKVPDKRIIPLVEAACPETDARSWYYALLDLGAHLKRTAGNSSRRSSAHTRQSRFEGSHRQRRAEVVRILLEARPEAPMTEEVMQSLNEIESRAGRAPVEDTEVQLILGELEREGFCREAGGFWTV